MRHFALVAALLVACAPEAVVPAPPLPPPPAPPHVRILRGMELFRELQRLEEAEAFDEARCAELAPSLDEHVATYGAKALDIAVVWLRCGRSDKALALLQRAADGGAWAAWLRPIEVREDVIAALERRAFDPPMIPYVFVRLAELRRALHEQTGEARHAEDATKHVVRALALDLGYGPAWAELALQRLEALGLAASIAGPTAGPIALSNAGPNEIGRDHRRLALVESLVEQGLENAPGYVPLHLLHARLHVLRGAMAAALASIDRARVLDLDNPWPLVALGQVQAIRQDREAAGKAFAEALALDDTIVEAHLGLAALAREARDWGGAEEHLSRARTRGPAIEVDFEAARLALARRGLDAAVRAELARLAEKAPPGPMADYARALLETEAP
jgi:tetratricopeptide (TPR) repeat protein